MKRQKEKKKITVGWISSWVFGTLFSLGGLSLLVSGSYFSGIMVILGSLILIPRIEESVGNKFHFELSTGVKAVIVILVLIFFFSGVSSSTPPFLPNDVNTDSLDNQLMQSQNERYKDRQEVVQINEQKINVRDTIDKVASTTNSGLMPSGEYYENEANGYTLIVDDFTFEKKGEGFGKLKDITFIIKNNQGSTSLIPSLNLVVTDKKDSKYSVGKDVELSEWIQDGDSIRRKVVVDLSIGAISNPKEIKVFLTEWGKVVTSVSFPVNLSKSTTMG